MSPGIFKFLIKEKISGIFVTQLLFLNARHSTLVTGRYSFNRHDSKTPTLTYPPISPRLSSKEGQI